MSQATDTGTGTDGVQSLLTKPFEDTDAKAGGGLRRAALTAAAAALAGGLAGAAQELVARRHGEQAEADTDEPEPQATAEDGSGDEAEPGEESEPEEDGEPQASADEPEERGDAEEPDEEPDDEPQASADEPKERGDAEEPDEEPDDEPQGDTRDDTDGDRRRDGASPDKAGELVRNARRQLQELIGAEPETVSAIRRNGDGWAVTFEVVEIRRIPESTDVLASYAVTLDDDGNLLDLERSRRYRRAQVDES
jgi:hypothetical protein